MSFFLVMIGFWVASAAIGLTCQALWRLIQIDSDPQRTALVRMLVERGGCAMTHEQCAIKQARALTDSGHWIAAMKLVRSYLRDRKMPFGINDARRWAARNGVNLGGLAR